MIELREQVTLDQVVTGMLHSHCFADRKNGIEPALPDTAEGRYRLLVDRGHLFLRFLPHCDWYHGLIRTSACLGRIRLIAEESWFPTPDGADRTLSHWAGLEGLSAGHVERVGAMVRNGLRVQSMHRRVTLFSHDAAGPYTVLDGNHRLLALAHQVFCKGADLEPLSVHVGLSNGPCRWHGDPVVWEERPPFEAKQRFVLRVW